MPGFSLGPDGEAAAALARDALADLKVKAIYTSPIERTMQTAAIIAAPHRLTPIVEPGVLEMDFGTWEGRTLNALRKLALWKVVQRSPSRMRFPDGESFSEAQTRAVDAVERIAAATGSETAIVVSHSDVIKLVVSYYLGQPLDMFQRMMISTASITDIRLAKGQAPFVVSVNHTGVRG
jgi:probable phosphoglycerate mutase